MTPGQVLRRVMAVCLQAGKNNKPLLVPVTFMNGYRTLCEIDSASTVQELVHNIAEKIGLLDPTGYSIYVTLHTKVSKR